MGLSQGEQSTDGAGKQADDKPQTKTVPQDSPIASTPANNSPTSSSTLTKKIEAQVTTLEDEAIALENSEIQARVRQLIKLIKTGLQSRTLDPKTQRELARLLSLTPTLDRRHTQQLNLLELAVSTLLEPDGVRRGETESQRAADTSSTEKNLVFTQETRRQVTHQVRPYPDLFRTIFIIGGGTPYIRLISGLSWFFVFFVLMPLTVAGATFVARDIAGFTSAQATIEALQARNDSLEADKSRQKAQIETLTRRRDALAGQLGRTGSQIAAIAPAVTVEEAATGTNGESAAVTPAAGATNNGSASSGAASNGAASNGTDSVAGTPDQVLVDRSKLTTIEKEIEDELRSDLNREANATGEDTIAEVPATNTGGSDVEGAPSASLPVPVADSLAAAERIFTTSFSLILLAVAMGALGSTISVIVRANTFIRQAQENNNDLFLTGFFRPFVGMSFAIFCVALVEAGIFSGIFDLTNRKETDRTYFYVAIAFIAGFSERLVRDVVIKTEDTLAGSADKSDGWE